MLVLNSLLTLATCTYDPTNKCDNHMWNQPILVLLLSMELEVLHNSCNMCICDLPDVYALEHTYQENPSYPCYNYYICQVFYEHPHAIL